MDFIPDCTDDELVIPFFEEANGSDGVVGYSTQKSLKDLRSLIIAQFARLGGTVTDIQSGKIGKRYAYRIQFNFNGHPGRMDVSALPIRRETDSRVEQAKKHALYSVWKRLEAEYNSLLVMPGDVPFVPYMLNEGGQTMLEYLRELGTVPSLPTAIEDDAIYEGEYTDQEEL